MAGPPDPDLEHRFVVVGAGSAGCALLGSLLEGLPAGAGVLLVEQGSPNAWEAPVVTDPVRWSEACADAELSRTFISAPQSQLFGRSPAHPFGLGAGGCGNVNAAFHARGCKEDYTAWPWPWAELERCLDLVDLRVRPQRLPETPLGRAFASAVQVPKAEEADAPEGGSSAPAELQPRGWAWSAGTCTTTLTAALRPAGGGQLRRTTAWEAFVRPLAPEAQGRLRVLRGQVTRLIFSSTGLEPIVSGVAGVDPSGRPFEAHALGAGEVVLCGGAIQTPHLLLLSGIGPAEHLQSVGVGVVQDLPGVGAVLLEHPLLPTASLAAGPIAEQVSPTAIHATAVRSVCVSGRQRTVVLFAADGGASVPLAAELLLPRFLVPPGGAGQGRLSSVALWALAVAWRAARPAFAAVLNWAGVIPGVRKLLVRSVGIAVGLLDPDSRGSVRLRSADPSAAPLLDGGLLREGPDLDALAAGAAWATRALAAPALAPHLRLDVLPGLLHTPARFARQLLRLLAALVLGRAGSAARAHSGNDAQPGWFWMTEARFRRFARLHVQPFHHACGTCPARSLAGTPLAEAAASGGVVGEDFAVLGVQRLRIADASVFPTIPRAPTAASAMAVGVLAAEKLLQGFAARARRPGG